MTPEETISFNENFLYPLYLLLIGGGLTVGLIKLFNFLNEIKLRKLDREREDYRFEIEIKERIILKNSERISWYAKKFQEITLMKTNEEKSKLGEEVRVEVAARHFPLSDLITLYFKNKVMEDLNFEIFAMMNSGIGIATTEANSEGRKQMLDHFQREFNLNFNKEEYDRSLTQTVGFFEPCPTISETSGRLSGFIHRASVKLHDDSE